MSCFLICDCDDCYNDENGDGIYKIELDSSEFLELYFKDWFKGFEIEHICSDCVDITNEDYKDFFIKDGYGSVSVSDAYMKNDEFINNRKKELQND